MKKKNFGGRMKQFFHDHSYHMVKMFLNQFASAMLGFSLALVSSRVGNVALRNATSIGSILFYLFLIYTMTWEIGFHDRSGVLNGSRKKVPLKGLFISLCANAINFILAFFVMLASVLPQSGFSSVGGVCGPVALLIEGMYMGLLANPLFGQPLNSYWFVYFLLPIPALLTSALSYFLGLNDKKFTGLFDYVYPESDREDKKKHFFKK